MARKPGAGRKPAKNETAAGLINALKFIGNLKAPTAASLPEYSHVSINHGMAVGFDGIVAAGHPVDDGITGCPHTKLFLEALENTDKNFTLTVRETGEFEINSGKYSALVPANAEYATAINRQPDMNQGGFSDGAAFVQALEAAGRVVSESGDVALYSAVKLTDKQTAKATDSATIVEVYHGNNTPPVILPKQFVTALVKSGKNPVGMGIDADWKFFTVWLEGGAWLRTALYPADTWPASVDEAFAKYISHQPDSMADVPPKLWAVAKTLLPFADGDRRLIIRPGLIRTHPDRRVGAAQELADISFELDVDGKRLLSVETLAQRYAIGSFEGGRTFVFYGERCRGVVAGLRPLPNSDAQATGGWGTSAPETSPQQANGGWAMSDAPIDPPPAPEAPKPSPGRPLEGIPAHGLAGDPEYESERQGIPAEQIPVAETLYIFDIADNGIPLDGFLPAQPDDKPLSETGQVSGWLNTISDQGE